MLEKFQMRKGKSIDWPLSESCVLAFIDWLYTDRKVKVSTVNTYLSGIRQLHIAAGFTEHNIRTELVNIVLKGKMNQEKTQKDNNKGRIPMTINMLKLMNIKIKKSNLDPQDKLLIIAVSTLMFHGAFRGGELLSQLESTFDPDYTLLATDVKDNALKEDSFLEISLKCPKEHRSGRPTIIDVFKSKGQLCPVTAFRKWKAVSKPEPNLPLFRLKNGTPLTIRHFNKILNQLLGYLLTKTGGTISSHSFRIGLASLLGTKGFSDKEQ